MAFGAASASVNAVCIGFLGVGVASSFVFGAAGDYWGSYETAKIDNVCFNPQSAMQSAILAGSLNIFAGIGSGIASTVGGASKMANATMNTIFASKFTSSMLIAGTEATYDLISYLIRKVM